MNNEENIGEEEKKNKRKKIQDKFPWDKFEFFVDQFKKPCAALKVDNHLEVYRTSSDTLKAIIASELARMKTSATAENISIIKGLMEAKAYDYYRSRGEVSLNLRTRIIGNNKIAIDLGDNKWNIAVISKQGYEIKPMQEPYFIRYNTTARFSVDETGTQQDFDAYLSLINLQEYSDIIKAWTLSALIPGYPHFILMLLGTKGSGKSTATTLLKQLIDPSPIGAIGRPHNQDSLFLALAHSYVVAFDNVDSIGESFASDLARAVTGEGNQRRKLYTDEDDMLFRFKRIIILNGINQPTRRADLLNRTLIFELENIPPDKRKPESDINEQVARLAPKVRGFIIKTIPKVIQQYIIVKKELTLLPRMADSTIWLEAAGRALGYEKGHIYNRLMSFLESEDKSVLESSELGQLVIEAIESYLGSSKDEVLSGKDLFSSNPTTINEVEVTASEFLSKIRELASQKGIDPARTRDSSGRLVIPETTEALGRFMRAVASNFEAFGYQFIRKVGTDNKKTWIFRELPKLPSQNSSVIQNDDGKLPELPELPISPNFKGENKDKESKEKGESLGGNGNFSNLSNSTTSKGITDQLPKILINSEIDYEDYLDFIEAQERQEQIKQYILQILSILSKAFPEQGKSRDLLTEAFLIFQDELGTVTKEEVQSALERLIIEGKIKEQDGLYFSAEELNA